MLFGFWRLRPAYRGHHMAAVDAGARADVQQVVGGADGFFVVLHHQHGVAQVAQVL
jgi:hypothetical protein